MTKDDEVSSIAFTDLFGPRRSGCELEGGGERHRGLGGGSGRRKREDEDADKCRKGVEAK